MERVNLLPDEARLGFLERIQQRVEREFGKVLALSAGAVLSIGLLFWMGQAIGLKKGQKRLAALKQEIQVIQVEGQNLESFSKQLDQVGKELERQEKILEWKVKHLKNAQERPKLWAALLKDLRRNIPGGVWLSELETSPDGRLRVAGGATDENLVSQFMSNLKESPRFTNVGFTFTEKDSIGNVGIVKFEIICQVG